jgi:hypothetical protein
MMNRFMGEVTQTAENLVFWSPSRLPILTQLPRFTIAANQHEQAEIETMDIEIFQEPSDTRAMRLWS